MILYGNNQIEKGVFGNITAKAANSWDMLQLADVCATTTFLAHEVNGWGFRTSCFFKVLQNHLYRRKGKVIGYGLKYFSDTMKPRTEDINGYFPCEIQERASGATSTD